tara:strand:- start:5129 stop:5995 length:867 start_codon:yes stop_codon:yes gene_type:complete
MDWIRNTYNVLDVLLSTNVEYLINSTNDMITNLWDVDYTSLGTNLFMRYIEIKIKLNTFCKYLYTNYDIVKNSVDITSYNIEYQKARYNKHRIEPFEEYWICVSMLLNNNKDKFSGNEDIYLENYQFIKPHLTPDISQKEYYNECLTYFTETASSIASCDKQVLETMVTMRIGNNTFNKSFNKGTIINQDESNYCNTLSKVSFLSIEYTHPKMDKKIVINIPKSMYFANNNILSALFIKRYLEYQYEPYIFDNKYTLNLMDNNVKMFSMKYTDSIVLSENTYQVVKNE